MRGALSRAPFLFGRVVVALERNQMAKKIPDQRKQKRKPAQAKRKSPRPERQRALPPLNCENPNAWLDHITGNLPPFIRSLCKSVYYEKLLVRPPERAVLCKDGMTPQGGVLTIDENHPEETLLGLPLVSEFWGMKNRPRMKP